MVGSTGRRGRSAYLTHHGGVAFRASTYTPGVPHGRSLSLIPDRGLERPGPDQIQKGPHALKVCSVDVVGVLVVVHVHVYMHMYVHACKTDTTR